MDGNHHRPFQFSPILIGLVGIFAGAIMVATYHCIVGVCCHQRRAQNQISRRQNLPSNQQERPSSTINSRRLIPMFRYSKECNEGTCAVCLSDFKEGEAIRVLPECFHLFHVSCIDKWLNSHSNCPLCRADATPPQHVALSLPHYGGVPPPEFHSVPDFGG